MASDHTTQADSDALVLPPKVQDWLRMQREADRGDINVYTCGYCGGQIVTVDTAKGVTPMMIFCRATPHCDGTMQSAWYRCSQELEPTHEWYRPKSKKGLNEIEIEHLMKGGLLLRRAGEQEGGAP